MKIIFIGSSNSSLSGIPLQTLINSKHYVSAFAFDAEENSHFNIIRPNSNESLASNNGIPLIRLDKNFIDATSIFQTLEPDIILVSCYSRHLPKSIISIAKKGCFNLHPSLLPQFRGPAPLFWQFRQGVESFGITLHRVIDEFDAGNIVGKKEVSVEDGAVNYEVTELLAHAASSLIIDMLNNIDNNCLVEKPQNNTISSYQSFPSKNNFSVDTSWKAKRIYNFIKAYKGEGISFVCEINNIKFVLVDAYSYQEKSFKNNDILVIEGELITFKCENSYIQCKLKTN